jgi:amino acid transporter
MSVDFELKAHDVRVSTGRRLNLIPLIGTIFFIVCGGAYGLEPLVGAVGPAWALILILLTPIFWSLPIALMVAELSSALPVDGGYYVWVRTALGEFWAFQEGWWTICYMVVDLAVFPVLFVNYLAYFFPTLQLDGNGSASWNTWLLRWGIAVAVIAIAFAVNTQGAKLVGQSSTLNLVLLVLPFSAIVIGALAQEGSAGRAISAISQDLANNRGATLLVLGLSTVMWNYMAWDNVSTFAGEVNHPQRNYPRAIGVALILTVAAYLIPTFAGIAVTTDPQVWNESSGWPDIARLIGGDLLGPIVAGGALLATWSLFNGQLLYVSRLPYAMALDGWMPSPLKHVSETAGVPLGSLLACCSVAALFAALSFGKLVLIDVLLYSAALSLEFAALIALRKRAPEMSRPFRIPGGWPGVILVALAPLSCGALLVITSVRSESAEPRQALIVIGAMLSGVLLFVVKRRRRNSKSSLS